MEDKTITISIKKAKKWYNSNNKELKTLALETFSKEELETETFSSIKTFNDALNALEHYASKKEIEKVIKGIAFYSKASAAMFKLNIIRRALNKDYDLHLKKDARSQNYTWYPYFRFVTKSSTYYDDELKRGEYKKLGEVVSEGITYNVLGGRADYGGHAGLGFFYSYNGVGNARANVGFLGCATEEIAKHFGKYFGMLIMEAMYADMLDIKFINNINE